MQRRTFFKSLLAAPAVSLAAAADFSDRVKGLPPLTIKDVRVITTNGGGNYRWVFLKIITSEDGLYSIGSANDNYQTFAVATALEKHLKPWLIGKDPDRIKICGRPRTIARTGVAVLSITR
jgi:mannonate dehydratase